MALKFSLDLEGATFDELATFVESLKTAGMKDHDTLTLDGTQLVATVEPTGGQVSLLGPGITSMTPARSATPAGPPQPHVKPSIPMPSQVPATLIL